MILAASLSHLSLGAGATSAARDLESEQTGRLRGYRS